MTWDKFFSFCLGEQYFQGYECTFSKHEYIHRRSHISTTTMHNTSLSNVIEMWLFPFLSLLTTNTQLRELKVYDPWIWLCVSDAGMRRSVRKWDQESKWKTRRYGKSGSNESGEENLCGSFWRGKTCVQDLSDNRIWYRVVCMST